VHTHHIVPVYRCKELGLTTSYKIGGKEFYFKENALPGITRLQHANIHWGYSLKDLSPLLELCSPPQWVIDMIPLGDKRDSGSAVYLAKGEIDGIDISGENNPNYKHGKAIKGSEHHYEYIREKQRKWYIKNNYYAKNRDAINERQRKYQAKNRDAIIEKQRKWYAENRDVIIERQKNYYAENRDVIIERQKEYQKEYYAKNKDAIREAQRKWYVKNRDAINEKRRKERQGVGNLENFIS
jgi:hypothetical protein